jgi:hypothetical protein
VLVAPFTVEAVLSFDAEPRVQRRTAGIGANRRCCLGTVGQQVLHILWLEVYT